VGLCSGAGALLEGIVNERRRIVVWHPSGAEETLFKARARDNCTEPYLRLRAECERLGYSLEGYVGQSLAKCARIVVWDLPTSLGRWSLPWRVKEAARRARGRRPNLPPWIFDGGRRDRLLLVLVEPPSVLAENWCEENWEPFGTILTWNDDLVDGRRWRKFCFPSPEYVPAVDRRPFAQKRVLVNISMNKASNYPGELYSKREESIRYFESRWPDQFDLYGVGWDRPARVFGDNPARGHRACRPYPSYRGTVANKWDVLPQYRYALCYENLGDMPGWITEKVFDCMRADCVPIYWGAPNVARYVDQGAFIDRRAFSGDEELAEFLVSIDETEYARYRDACASYLASPRFARFTSAAFVRDFIAALDLDAAH
jgi:hypothetical protein